MHHDTLGDISLLEFYTRSLQTMDKRTADEVSRHIKKGLFEILWQRLHGENPVVVTYKNIGHACSAVTSNNSSINVFTARLRDNPVTGIIRSPASIHLDFRFVSIIHNGAAYLLLENSAIDSKVDQVWKYCENMDGFIPMKIGFLDFLLRQKVEVVPVLRNRKAA